MMTNTIVIILGSLVFLCIIFTVYLVLNIRKVKAKNVKLEEEIKELKGNIYSFAEEGVKKIEDKYEVLLTKLRMSNNNYEVFFNYLKERLKNARIEMDEVDRRGSFKADDEVGFIFNVIYDVSADLSKFLENVNIKEIDQDILNRKLNQ